MAARKGSSKAKQAAEQPVSDRQVDEALQDTFPASDPPFFVGGVAGPHADVLTKKEGQRPARHDED